MSNKLSLTSRIQAFTKLSGALSRISAALGNEFRPQSVDDAEKTFCAAVEEAEMANPWFTRRETVRALGAISHMTNEKSLLSWTASYPALQKETGGTKTVGVIMAGNLPLVGFHDLLCVVLSGHRFVGKLSSQDALLPVALAELLVAIEPGLKSQIAFTCDLTTDADAIIATGSDNTARYFEHHFGDKPHIIRKNRNSIAVLHGNETADDLQKLGEDIFAYFGLGCRSVSHICIPKDFDLSRLKDAWKPFEYLLLNKKYKNNLSYYKALFEVSGTPYRQLGHCILTENTGLASPLSVIHYSSYHNIAEAEKLIQPHANGIQCVVSEMQLQTVGVPLVPFGHSQYPKLDDYADGVDTICFLTSL